MAPPGSTNHHYMAWPAVLVKKWLTGLHKHIEELHGKPWQEVLYHQGLISEYCIYGTYVEEVLMPENIVLRETPFNMGIWTKGDFKSLETKLGNNAISGDYLCLTIQSNLDIPVKEYEACLENFFSRQAICTGAF